MLRRGPRPDLSRSRRAKGNLSFLSHLSDIRHIATIRFPLKGDRLLEMLAALANPRRLRIAAVLAADVRDYVGKPAGTWHQPPIAASAPPSTIHAVRPISPASTPRPRC
jgi:hypothetical protein